MPRRKRSCVPQLVSDAELAEFPRITLRKRRTSCGEIIVDVCYRHPFTNESQTRRAGSTRAEILAALEQTREITQAARPTTIKDPKTPFGQVAQRWFDENPDGLAPSTLDNYSTFCNAHVLPRLSTLPVSRISHDQLRLLLKELESNGVGRHARYKTRTLVIKVFGWAKTNGYIVYNPSGNLTKIDGSSAIRKHDFFSPSQSRRITDDETYRLLEERHEVRHAGYFRVHMLALLDTPLRIGELAALRWSDFHYSDDPGGSSLKVRASRRGGHISAPKTAAGVREFYISSELAQALQEHRIHQYDHVPVSDGANEATKLATWRERNPDDFIFTSPRGIPLDTKGFGRRVFRRICAAAGIELLGHGEDALRPHPHSTRHTWITHAREGGVEANTVMSVAGQKDMRALNRYSGTTDQAKRDAISKQRARIGRE